MSLDDLNNLENDALRLALSNCCGASVWVQQMIDQSPFESKEKLYKKAEDIWYNKCDRKDWLEAFTHHPKIGDLKSLEEKFATTKAWASAEQAGVQKADASTIIELQKGNEAYEKKFGFIFIVCASGKSAEEMLQLLEDRLPNHYNEELKIAMEEQHKITTLRLQKLLS